MTSQELGKAWSETVRQALLVIAGQDEQIRLLTQLVVDQELIIKQYIAQSASKETT